MSTILDEIITYKRNFVQTAKESKPYTLVEKEALATPAPPHFRHALVNPDHETMKLIAEIKKASPSKGIIQENFNPLETAKTYAKAGANCISVLTDQKYFQGHDDFLKEITRHLRTPCLRKEFIVDEYQILEARALGASAILLIVDCLSDAELIRFQKFAWDLELDVLVETHREDEVLRAIQMGANLIGINNRNLRTFETHLETTFELRNLIPSDALCVSESGIQTHEDILKLLDYEVDAVLIGETLMRQQGGNLKELLGKDEDI